jgi:hypothetical protein
MLFRYPALPVQPSPSPLVLPGESQISRHEKTLRFVKYYSSMSICPSCCSWICLLRVANTSPLPSRPNCYSVPDPGQGAESQSGYRRNGHAPAVKARCSVLSKVRPSHRRSAVAVGQNPRRVASTSSRRLLHTLPLEIGGHRGEDRASVSS